MVIKTMSRGGTEYAFNFPKEANQCQLRESANQGQLWESSSYPMPILIWNVRGLNKKERRRDLKSHMAKLSPNMVVLVETKIRPHKEYRIWKCIPRYWDFVNKYEFSNLGRIWICWCPKIWSCHVINKAMQQITVKATNKGEGGSNV